MCYKSWWVWVNRNSLNYFALNINVRNVTYFDSFRVKRILKEIRKFIGNENIIANIYKIQAYGSIMYRYICIGFVDFKLKGNSLLKPTNYFLLINVERMIK